MRRIIEQSRVTRDTGARVYPAARSFAEDGVAPSASMSIRCKRTEREAAFDARAASNAAWLTSHVSASPSASPRASSALARAEKQRAARLDAQQRRALARERTHEIMATRRAERDRALTNSEREAEREAELTYRANQDAARQAELTYRAGNSGYRG